MSNNHKKQMKHMNKPGILTFIAVLLVIAVSVSGCGKNDEVSDAPSATPVTGEAENITKQPDITQIPATPAPTSEENKNDEITPEPGTKQDDDNTNAKVTVTLGEYKGLSAKYEPKIITDEGIEDILEQLQSYCTSIVDLPNRAFEKGDMAIVTFQADADGKEIKELSGSYLQVIIGEGVLPETIENEMIGKRIGDKFESEVVYSAGDGEDDQTSVKKVHFTIWIEDGFMFYVPDINDEFIQTYTVYSSLEEFRTKEKERLQGEENDKALETLHKELKEKVIAGCVYEGPVDDEIMQAYVLKLQEEDKKYKEMYYIDAATYYSMTYDMTREEYQKSVRDELTMDIKFGYAADEIMKKENLSTLEEVEKLIYDTAVITTD